MDLPVFGRRKVVQGIVRDVLVVVPELGLGLLPDLSQISKVIDIQHAATVTPVEPLGEAVLHRLTGLDQAELDGVRLSPPGQGD